MKRIALLLLLCLLVPLVPTTAQEGNPCSPESIASRVGEAYTAYSDAAASDLEASLNSMSAMEGAIQAIYTKCDEVRYQAYIDEGATLLEHLRAGGYVLYVRHAKTDQSQEDTDLSSCETQRNLNEQGRIDAAAIGEVWVALNLPVSRIISTEYCRTRETAELAFGEPEVIPRDELAQELDYLLSAEIPDEGTNMVIVGHVDLLEEVTGIQVPEDVRLNEGDALVYRPLGGPMGDAGYELVARISLRNWTDLARLAAAI
jgi:phosphohistidine phosphatase SixA